MKYYSLLFVLFVFSCSPQNKIEDKAIERESKISLQNESKGNCVKCLKTDFADQEPDTTFTFSNGKKLNICGYVETEGGKRIFSEFVLHECGQDSIVNFWGAVENYEIEFSNDTLKLNNLELLALGEKQELISQKWLTEYFYFAGNHLTTFIQINPKVKYNDEQIRLSLKQYEQTKWSTQNSGVSEEYGEEKMELANKLMIAAISGSAKAEEYFIEFEKKFQPDGAYAEWYDEMAAMLSLAKKLN